MAPETDLVFLTELCKFLYINDIIVCQSFILQIFSQFSVSFLIQFILFLTST